MLFLKKKKPFILFLDIRKQMGQAQHVEQC